MVSKGARRAQRAILVHNPTAGQGDHSADELLALLRRFGYAAEPLDAKDDAAMARLPKKRGLVFVAGGDGTVKRVALRLVGCKRTIAVLPFGTANNIARSLGIEGDAAAALGQLKRAKPVTIDIGVARGPWGTTTFVEGVGAGLFADVMAALDSGRAPRRRRRQARDVTRFTSKDMHLQRALHALADALPRYRAKVSEVSIDGRKLKGRFILLGAMNMRFVGPNLLFGPDVELADERLDFVMLEEAGRADFQDYLQHRVDGGRDAPKLTIVKGRRLSFAWSGGAIHIDDEPISIPRAKGKAVTIDVVVKKAALRFLVPPRPRRPRADPASR